MRRPVKHPAQRKIAFFVDGDKEKLLVEALARKVMEQIIANGHVDRGRIGVSLKDLHPSASGRDDGALVADVAPESPVSSYRSVIANGPEVLSIRWRVGGWCSTTSQSIS